MSKVDQEPPKSRAWCFTWNSFPEDYVEKLKKLNTTYIVFGIETGDKTGNIHVQGYAEFPNQVYRKAILKTCPASSWFPRKGTAAQAADYCGKNGHRVEIGTISKQGKRTDLDKVRDQLQDPETASMRAITSTATSCQSIRFAEIYLKYHEAKRDFKPHVIWLYGGPGTCKTARAMAYGKRVGDIHMQTVSAKWWEGYDNHPVVIIDDLRKTFCEFATMLNLLDRYEFRIECKGGTRQLLATHIFITSPKPPEQVWSTDENLDQLTRRIDVIAEILSIDECIYHKNGLPPLNPEEICPTQTQEGDLYKSLSRSKEVCTESHPSPGDEVCVAAHGRSGDEHTITGNSDNDARDSKRARTS